MGSLNITMLINWGLSANDIKKFASHGYIVLVCIMGQIKAAILTFRKNDFGDLVNRMDIDVFKPINGKERSMVSGNMKTYIYIRNLLVVWCHASTTALIATPLLDSGSRYDEIVVPAYCPLNLSNPAIYTLTYIHQGVAITYISACNIYTDMISAAFLTFIGLQCDLLSARLLEIEKCVGESKRTKFIRCMHHYSMILRFLKTTEKVFGKIYFGQLFASTTALCMDLFLLSLTEPKTFEFFYLVVYLLAVANLLLVPCWFSTEMTRKSENIPFAAYSCDWVDSSNSFKKELIFFIRRAQRPLKFYAVDFFEISVETFVKIIRTSLSYYAVLNNLNMEEKYY
ncbi:odorant receptor 4-like isoform X5 [Cylas formicarius]|uniref:odorant receptor 4-like isoform X5 n=1 Tax=Cylas formicarius TaxID=197179 RepID=UPI00295852AE|nr:odorant receptor 4-like isoform X5 [Cylas formicarius]